MMNDQAESLRRRLKSKTAEEKNLRKSRAKTMAIVSGKGGVGKTNISVNLAIGLVKMGKKVLLFDMDIGMGNIYHLLNESPSQSIADFFTKGVPLQNLIKTTSEGLAFIHGGSAASHLFEWEEFYREKWIMALDELIDEYDYLLFDMGAGASKESLNILLAAEEVLTVMTPEPTAMTDAYSMMKFIYLRDPEKQFYLLCNRADTKEEGQITIQRLQRTMQTFLNVNPSVLGSVPEDTAVRKSVIAGRPFTIAFPEAQVSRAFDLIVKTYAGVPAPEKQESKGFINKLRRFFKEKKDNR